MFYPYLMMQFDRCLFSFKRVPKPSTKFVEGDVCYLLTLTENPYPGPDPAVKSSLNHQARMRVKQL